MRIERTIHLTRYNGIIKEAEEILGRLDQESGPFEYYNDEGNYMVRLNIRPEKGIVKGQPVSHQWVDVHMCSFDFDTKQKGISYLIARMHYK